MANKAWRFATARMLERHLISAACLQGVSALYLKDLEIAEDRLHYAIKKNCPFKKSSMSFPTHAVSIGSFNTMEPFANLPNESTYQPCN